MLVGHCGGNYGDTFVLIVVLFILLVIVGAVIYY
ncbi:YjcZ family sporulation protein [Thalassobacillus hwangdonensis]|uniref:YjcZ family sporulation protein n=1 Tax=Thalassobacillus hwangdonensis TaxID=546108 RepID=A0ABW3KVQ4_9BACI